MQISDLTIFVLPKSQYTIISVRKPDYFSVGLCVGVLDQFIMFMTSGNKIIDVMKSSKIKTVENARLFEICIQRTDQL